MNIIKILANQIQQLAQYPNSVYELIKVEFLYHSNKLEGSTFTRAGISKLYHEREVVGDHKLDDIYETTNSLDAFDYIVNTLEQPLIGKVIKDIHSILKRNTLDYQRGWSGKWKTISNHITGSKITTVQPWEVENRINNLLEWWDKSSKDINAIATFHAEFELIHPFTDGNGRVGRFIILKQCIENNIDLISIDEKISDVYKSILQEAQLSGDVESLVEIFIKSQDFLSDKLEYLKASIASLDMNSSIINRSVFGEVETPSLIK